MKPIPPFMALAGAAVVLATGYAWGAAANASDPFLNTKVLHTSGITYATGPDAEPPPWPADGAKAPPPRPAIMQTAATQPSLVPPEVQRVDPAGALALNSLPSSATNPVSQPPPDPTTSIAPVAQPVPAQDDQRVPRSRPRRVIQKEVSFGTTTLGQPVTIIWNDN